MKRSSGTSGSPSILNASPESAAGGNLALLRSSARLGLIDRGLAESVHGAYRRYRELQHQLRLAGEHYARIDRSGVEKETDCVQSLWRALFGAESGIGPRP